MGIKKNQLSTVVGGGGGGGPEFPSSVQTVTTLRVPAFGNADLVVPIPSGTSVTFLMDLNAVGGPVGGNGSQTCGFFGQAVMARSSGGVINAIPSNTFQCFGLSQGPYSAAGDSATFNFTNADEVDVVLNVVYMLSPALAVPPT